MAAGAVGALSSIPVGAALTAPTALPIHLVVADQRFAASRVFAAEAARAGRRIAWTRGDVTRLWCDQLDLLWREQAAVVAGLTDPAAFFCLERLALDRGLRVAFKGEHRRLASGETSHVIAGHEGLETRVAFGPAWPAQAARLVLAARNDGPAKVRLQTIGQAHAGQPPLLISWVLAPKRQSRI